MHRAALRAAYDNAPWVALVGLHLAAGAIILPAVGRGIPYAIGPLYEVPAILTGLYISVALLIGIAVDVFAARRKPSEPETWRHLSRRWLGTRRLVGTLIALAALPVLLNVMAGFRLALTDIKPFAYDQLFMEWDRWLHFGRHPWELIQPIVGHPAVTRFIDQAYLDGWILMMWGCTIWQAVHGSEPRRLQYFLSFAGCWVLLGSFAAVALSSAGPVYYGRVTGLPDPFGPLIQYLGSVDASAPLTSVEHHEKLWLTYTTWGGITAMPSMHIAITTVVALTLVSTRRWLAIVAIPGWILMMVASVHLAWHYALDGYAAALATGGIWWASGRFARWWEERGPELRGAYADVD